MTTNPIRLGIIGLGAMGTEMLGAALPHPDFDVRLAADLSDTTVVRQRTAHPDVVFTADPTEVLGSTEIDAVYITTPPVHHADLAVAALRSGKAVFCEKPLAISLADGRRMAAAAAESGRATAINYSLSDRNATLELERAIAAGEPGRITGVEMRLRFPQWPRAFQADATWLAGRAQGGFLREVFSHFAYLTDQLLGELTPVHLDVTYGDDPESSEIAAHGLLRANGVPMQVSGLAGVVGPELYEWTLWGTERSYQLRNWTRLFRHDGDDWARVELPAESGSEATRLTRFAAVVRGGKPEHLADFAAALRVQQVVEAFHAR
jgi:predicted dehydrogenase